MAAGAEREAAGELERAIGLYDEGPRPGELHWFAGMPLAGIDLAVVRLRSGALDAAAEALQPALSLPIAQRISEVTDRFKAVRDELGAPIFRGSPQARDLGRQIEEFGRKPSSLGCAVCPVAQGSGPVSLDRARSLVPARFREHVRDSVVKRSDRLDLESPWILS